MFIFIKLQCKLYHIEGVYRRCMQKFKQLQGWQPLLMYSGPGVNWNYALAILEILTQSTDLKAILKSTNFL